MENKIVKVSKENHDFVISKAKLFEWKLDKEENKGYVTVLSFSRDNEVPYYSELVKLEEEYGEYKFIPFIAIVIPAALAFLAITALLIVFFTQREVARQYWYVFIIPSALFLFVSMILTFFRMRTFDQIMSKKGQKDVEFSAKIKKLKDNNPKNP